MGRFATGNSRVRGFGQSAFGNLELKALQPLGQLQIAL